MKKIIAPALIFLAILGYSIFPSYSKVEAVTPSEQAQINALLAMITQLQQQLALLLSQNTDCTVITKDLYIGLNDSSTSGEVTKLQKFLKNQGDYTYPTITGFFGAATQSAVQKFQSRNAILYSGSPATNGFGIVGPTTRGKIKTVSCGSTPLPVEPVTPPPQPLTVPKQCADTVDNDGDGKIDMNDSGCYSPTDDTEADVVKKCNNGIDDDADGKIDYPADPGCTSATDNNENDSTAKCSDGLDNDGDDVIDYPYEPGCTSPSDTSEDNEPLMLIQNDYDNSVWNIAYSLGAKKSWLIGGDFGSADGTVNLTTLRKLIEGELGYPAVPTNFTGYAVLDIEDPYFAWLHESPSTQHFQYAQSEMLKALNYAKQLRPNAKWGYYGIPNFPIHFTGGSWADASDSAKSAEIEKIFAPTALLDAVDFYAPSIYSPYPDASTPSYLVEKEKARNKEAVKQSIPRSNGKPIFTYISDRFWNSNPVYNYKSMPYQEFKNKQFIGMQNGADGVFLWGGDNYWYNLGYVYDPAILPAYALESRAQIRAAWDPEFPSGIDPHVYINAFQEQTLRIVAQKLFGTSYTPHWPLFEVGGNNEGEEQNTSPVCGNGVVESGEQCDGSSLAGASCLTQGFSSGSISCTSSCTLNTSQCLNSIPDGDIQGDGRKVSFFSNAFSQLASVFQAVLNFFGF
ncbi:MAG: peptidoglycan-binding protein [Candidatus Paceibacterota bacterium]